MTTTYKLDKSFGPAGSFAGIVVFCAGLILCWFHLSGVILVLIGAFVGFTYTSTSIDVDKKRIKFSNNLFGIISTGKWITIKPSMSIGLRKSNQIFRAYSMGNRALDATVSDFRIVLYDAAHKEILTIKKEKSFDVAKAELEAIWNILGLKQV
jgi:hypothetical protein